jgi:hypothetical protein
MNMNLELLPKIRQLSYLFTDDADTCVAHCLELDLVAVGATRTVAEQRLDTLVRAQIKMIVAKLNFADLTFAAPQDYWDRFYEGQEFKKAQLELEVPPMFVAVQHKVHVPVYMRALAA